MQTGAKVPEFPEGKAAPGPEGDISRRLEKKIMEVFGISAEGLPRKGPEDDKPAESDESVTVDDSEEEKKKAEGEDMKEKNSEESEEKNEEEQKTGDAKEEPTEEETSKDDISAEEKVDDNKSEESKEQEKAADDSKKEDEKKDSVSEDKEDSSPEEGKTEDGSSDESKEDSGKKNDDKEKGKPGDKRSKKDKLGKKDKKEKKDEKPETLEDLVAHKEEIEALLSSIEDSYRDATLPDKTYREVKEKNEKRLKEINGKIEKLKKEASPEKAPDTSAAPPSQPPPSQPAPAASAPPPVIPPATAPVQQQAPPPAQGPREEDSSGLEKTVEVLEESIEKRLKDVIATASVEVTDKRIRKVDSRLDDIEVTLKELNSTAETVKSYEKKFNEMKAELEKTKAMVESAKEAKNIMDEKVQRITENFAEVRSMVYQREAESKEQEVAMEKLKETVSHVDTSKILAEFSARDEQMRDINTRMERQERNTKMVTGDVSRIKGLMTDIGSLENIMKATKHVGEKLETIQEIENKMKAMFTKLEGVYVDMKKKLDEFSTYKVKADKIDGMVNDLTKNVEEQTRRMSDFVSKSDVDSLKTEIQGMKTEIQKKAAAPVTGAAPVNPQLQSEKEEIEALLATLDENYKSKQMPEEEYKKARESNEAKLAEIENKMKAGAPKPSGSPKEKKEEKMEHRRVEMLSKLRESYENGEISRRAYMKSRKLLLSK